MSARAVAAATVLAVIVVVMLLVMVMGPPSGPNASVYRTPKLPDVAATPAAARPDPIPWPALEAPAAAPVTSNPASGSGAAGLRWTLPQGWTDLPGSGMRLATVRVPLDQGAAGEISLMRVTAGPGMLTSNLNRWRGQFGLPALDAAQAEASYHPVKTGLGTAQVVLVENPAANPQAMWAALILEENDLLSIRFNLPQEQAQAVAQDFTTFLSSLRKDTP